MDRIKDAIRFVVISPEALSALTVYLIIHYYPEVVGFLSKYVANPDTTTFTLVSGVPLAMLVGIYRLGVDVLNPADQKKALKDWSGYWMIKYRIVFSLTIGSTGFASTLVAYFLANSGNPLTGTAIMVISWAVVASALASVAFARMSVVDVLHAGGKS